MYVDPSTGPLLLQLLLSAGVGTVVGFRSRIGRLWKRLTRADDDATQQDSASTQREPHDTPQ